MSLSWVEHPSLLFDDSEISGIMKEKAKRLAEKYNEYGGGLPTESSESVARK